MTPRSNKLLIGSGGGGKGGGGGAATTYAPSEIPDSLRSRAYVDVIYLIGEGPIQGLVFGAKSIYLNDIPVISADGSPSFNGVEVALREGWQTQLPIANDVVAADEHNVGVEVQAYTPWTVRITDPNVDAVVLTIGFPQLAQQNTETGEVGGASVELQFFMQSNNAGYQIQNVGYGPVAGIRHSNTLVQAASLAYDCGFYVRGPGAYRKIRAWVSPDNVTWYQYGDMELFEDFETATCVGYGVVRWAPGGPFFVKVTQIDGALDFSIEQFTFYGVSTTHQVNGKCLQRYQQQIRVTLSGSPPWDVRVVRVTPDSESSSLSNQTWVDGYRTETFTRLKYPNTALCWVRLPADQFSSIPEVKFDIWGLFCNIPDNYNPYTRTYGAPWGGNFTTAWTMNPAWCLWNLLSHTRYGLGDRQMPIDKWRFYEVAQYCDENIPDGKGGLIARFECHLSIDSFADTYEWIQTMCAIFRGMLYVIDGYCEIVADAPADPAYLFTNSNVVDGAFTYSGSSDTARHTAVYVTYKDFAANGGETVEFVPDPAMISRYGFNPTHVSALWCRRKRHARLIGEWMLETEKRCTQTVTFKPSSAESAFLRPGDIISIADEHRSGERRGGRILSNTTTTITTDAPVDIYGNTNNHLLLIAADGSVSQHAVLNDPGWTSTITFSPAISADPVDLSVWMINSVGRIEPQRFRVLEVEENDDGTATISALQHEPSLYNHIERDLPYTPTRISSVRPGAQQSPEGLTLTESLYLARDTTVSVRLTAAWQSAPGALNYQVRYRIGAGNWQSGGTSGDTVWELDNARTGKYQVSVVAVNALGRKSSAATATLQVRGKTAPPPKVSAFRVVSLRDGKRRAIFRYKTPPLDLRGFQLRYARGTKTAAQWGSMDPLHTGVLRNSPWEFTLHGTGTYTFACVGVDTSGNRSLQPVVRTLTLQAPQVDGVLVLSRSAREQKWPGTVTYGG